MKYALENDQRIEPLPTAKATCPCCCIDVFAKCGTKKSGTGHMNPNRSAFLVTSSDWVFDCIEDEIIGDCGINGNGAAGCEPNRVDPKLEPSHKITNFTQPFAIYDHFILVPEEQLTHLTNL